MYVENMNFAETLRKEANFTLTENGATALLSSENACVDLFGLIGGLRHLDYRSHRVKIDTDRARRLFADAYAENPLIATKILFYTRDIREGLGERGIVRDLFVYAAKYHPEALIYNLDLIGVYGRYDDLYSLIGTPLEKEMWATMKAQFEEDRKTLAEGKAISLLAKWIKTPDASSKTTRALGIETAKQLGYSVYEFKRILRAMRKQINVVERLMSAKEWDKISYSEVPSRAMMIYRNAFKKHDTERYNEFIQKALTGEVKINSGTLYPYDIVEKILYQGESADSLEAQWRQLPNYIEEGRNVLIMADVSASMYGRPMASSIGLAIYFAERNKGSFHNLFMTFSSYPTIVELKGETLAQKIKFLSNADWDMSTDLETAFYSILELAVNNHMSQDEMPKALVVVTDMEIDELDYEHQGWSFYDEMKAQFEENGYNIPNVVFWNVNSRNDTFLADASKKGVQLVSGQATSTFKNILKCMDMTPYEMMLKVLSSPRYDAITIANK